MIVVAAIVGVAWLQVVFWRAFRTRAPLSASAIIAFAPLVVLGVLLLIPQRGSGPASPRPQCISNMRQIGMGLLAYESVYGSLPPAHTTDASGRRLHSWRSHILPQISQQRLYDALDFSQPWNMGVNRTLSPQLALFLCPSTGSTGATGPYTSYVAVTGPETMWPDGECRRLDEVTDGLQNTILLVETTRTDIMWAEPRDLTLDEVIAAFENGDASGAGSFHQGGLNVVFADGHAEFIPLDRIDAATLRGLFTVDGGEEPVLPTP